MFRQVFWSLTPFKYRVFVYNLPKLIRVNKGANLNQGRKTCFLKVLLIQKKINFNIMLCSHAEQKWEFSVMISYVDVVMLSISWTATTKTRSRIRDVLGKTGPLIGTDYWYLHFYCIEKINMHFSIIPLFLLCFFFRMKTFFKCPSRRCTNWAFFPRKIYCPGSSMWIIGRNLNHLQDYSASKCHLLSVQQP